MLLGAALAACSPWGGGNDGNEGKGKVELLNTRCDPTRAPYKDANAAFAKQRRAQTGPVASFRDVVTLVPACNVDASAGRAQRLPAARDGMRSPRSACRRARWPPIA